MKEEMITEKYATWNNLASNLALVLWVISVLVILGYFVWLLMTKGSKNKYDLIVKNEIKFLWIASIIIIAGLCFYGNANIKEFSLVLVFVRGFVTIAFGLILALIIQTLLRFYYPFFIEKRLKTLRYKPRLSPKSGKPMKLLDEKEEDIYLDEGMQAEENVFSTDYDVWRDEETGYIQIEKYSGHLHAIQCPECNYQTFKVLKEELIKPSSPLEKGEIIKHYVCEYCGYRAKKSVAISIGKQAVEQKEE